ncbi:guanylate-binding protein 2-like [Montipora capricornis]|uniref:guanylate-binding protein 2-like n=1 Tax=Montipora capricornis TaxID=246305 RepID=UPI0035F1BD84
MTTAIPVCIPNNCSWDESSRKFQRDRSKPRSDLQLVEEAMRKLRSIHGPVCVVSIAGPYRKGKSYILSRVFDQPNVFPLGHSFEPETMGIWMWVVPEKYCDNTGREFTVVLLDSEGTDAVRAENVNDHAIFVLTVLLSSVLIYNSVGVPTRTDLEALDHIINVCQRIQVIAGQTIDDETARKIFPSFVWLLRDVVLSLPKGIENLKKYFLEKVFKVSDRRSDKSRQVVENILKFFPDFDAFPLSPPSADAEVMRHLSDAKRQGEINSFFVKGVEEFKEIMKAKIGPKQSFVGPGLVTGAALATLFEEYVRAINSPGAVPIVQSAWDAFTKTRCTEALADAKAVYDGGMKDLRLPCDDKKIRHHHEEQLIEALSFFENLTEEIEAAARWNYIEELADYASDAESALLRANNSRTDQGCEELIKSLREIYLEPVLIDLRDPEKTDFRVLEERLRSAYGKIDSDFWKQAPGSRSLSSNWAYVYELKHSEEMKQHLDMLKTRREYFEKIASERVARELEAEETEKIRRGNASLRESKEDFKRTISQLQSQHTEDKEELQRIMAEQMRLQEQEAQAAITRARERAETEKQQHVNQKRRLEAKIEETRERIRSQEKTISDLQEQLRRM